MKKIIQFIKNNITYIFLGIFIFLALIFLCKFFYNRYQGIFKKIYTNRPYVFSGTSQIFRTKNNKLIVIEEYNKIYNAVLEKNKLNLQYITTLPEHKLRSRPIQLDNGMIIFPVINKVNNYEYLVFDPEINKFTKSIKSNYKYDIGQIGIVFNTNNKNNFISCIASIKKDNLEIFNNKLNIINNPPPSSFCQFNTKIIANHKNEIIFATPNQSKNYINYYIYDLDNNKFKTLEPTHIIVTKKQQSFWEDKQIYRLKNNEFLYFEYNAKTKTNYISLFKIENNKISKIYTFSENKIKYSLGSGSIIELNSDEILITGGRSGFSIQLTWNMKNSYIYNIRTRQIKRINNLKYRRYMHSYIKLENNKILIYPGYYNNSNGKLEIFERGKLW